MKLAEQTADEILKLGTILSCCIKVAAEHDHSVISIYVSTHSLSTSFFFYAVLQVLSELRSTRRVVQK